jgi:hypothetical protein
MGFDPFKRKRGQAEKGPDTFIPGFSLPDPESIFTYTDGIQSPILILCVLHEAYFGEHRSNQTS